MVVAIVFAQDLWAPVMMRVAREDDTVTVCQLIIIDNLQLPVTEATKMFAKIKSELAKSFELEADMASFSWPVHKLASSEKLLSGMQALCHALSLMRHRSLLAR